MGSLLDSILDNLFDSLFDSLLDSLFDSLCDGLYDSLFFVGWMVVGSLRAPKVLIKYNTCSHFIHCFLEIITHRCHGGSDKFQLCVLLSRNCQKARQLGNSE